jgi:hypothetical protein
LSDVLEGRRILRKGVEQFRGAVLWRERRREMRGEGRMWRSGRCRMDLEGAREGFAEP